MTAPDLRIVSPAHAAEWTEAHIKELADTDQRMALELVARKFRDRLYYHALGIVKNGEEAYDVVQEVLIRAMREQRLFQAEFRIKAWLFRVTSNLCFNRVRDRRRRGTILETFPPPDRSRADQVDKVFKGERREEVLKAIDQMTRDHSEILLLRYYSDMSYAEIAAVLEVKLGTVMSRLSRARGRLLAVLGEAQHLRD